MNPLALQTRLKAAGYDPGPVDGYLGPRTFGALLLTVGGSRLPTGRISALATACAEHLPDFGITTRLRIVHMLAQLAHETAGWRFLEEVGGPTYLSKYDGRRDLGNVRPGDGARFKGRGPIQVTGRSNYRAYGRRIGLDLEAAPERAADPMIGMHIACLYWSDHGLNAYADADNGRAIGRAINRGNAHSPRPANGEADRLERVAELKAVWPETVTA